MECALCVYVRLMALESVVLDDVNILFVWDNNKIVRSDAALLYGN